MTDEAPAPDNRRKDIRVTLANLPVVVEFEGTTTQAQGGDFNVDSMLIFMDSPPPVGAELMVNCKDDSGKDVTFRASVIKHRFDDDGSPNGMVVTEVTA